MKRILTLAVLACSFVLLSCVETVQTQATKNNSNVVSTSFNSLEEEVLVHVNKYRKSKGLGALKMNNAIVDESRKHSGNMASGDIPFSHDGFNNRAKKIGTKIPGMSSVAENVAYGQRTAQEVVADWIKSPGHKMNIEGNFTQTGIGIASNGKGVLYYTQIFVR